MELCWAKEKELESGVVVGHWVMYQLNLDFASMRANVTCHGYLDQAAYEAGKVKLVEKVCGVLLDDFKFSAELAEAVLDKTKEAQLDGNLK